MNISSPASIKQPQAAAATHPTVTGKAATGHNFDLMLGCALALGELDQNLQTGIAPATGMQPTALKAPEALKADNGSTVTMDPATQAALFGALPAAMGQTKSKDAKQETLDEDGSNANAAALLNSLSPMGLPVVAATPNPATQAPAAMPSTAPLMPQAATPTVANAPAASATTTPAMVQAWNVRDLAQQLGAALNSLEGKPETPVAQQSAPTAEGMSFKRQPVPAQPQAPAAPVGATVEALMNTLKNPVAAQPEIKGQPTEFKLAVLQKEVAPDPLDPTKPTSVATPAALSQWAAQPITSPTEGTRMPTLIEQVRQVADFLAARTDGVVKLSENGMEANLKLYPPDLGPVRVELTVNNDRTAQAQFFVERPETALLLQQHMRSFQDSLGRQGLVVDRVLVTLQQVSPGGATSEGGWRQPDSQAQRREGALFQNQQQSRNGQGQRKDRQAWSEFEQ